MILQNTGLKLEMGRGDSDDGVASIHLFLFTKGNEDVSGRKIVVNGRVRPGDPHIHLSCQRTDDRAPRSQAHLDYLLVLEFGEYNAERSSSTRKNLRLLPRQGKEFLCRLFRGTSRLTPRPCHSMPLTIFPQEKFVPFFAFCCVLEGQSH